MICCQTPSRSRRRRSMTKSPFPVWCAMLHGTASRGTCAVPCPAGKGTDVTDPGLRASDTDRERVVAALERHTAAGRLTLDEFGQRVGRVFSAVTQGDLAAVTHDLPAEPPVAPQHRQ